MNSLRDMLVNALMRSLLIEVDSVSRDDAVQLVSVEDEKVIGTLAGNSRNLCENALKESSD